jgi:hypothetical protein
MSRTVELAAALGIVAIGLAPAMGAPGRGRPPVAGAKMESSSMRSAAAAATARTFAARAAAARSAPKQASSGSSGYVAYARSAAAYVQPRPQSWPPLNTVKPTSLAGFYPAHGAHLMNHQLSSQRYRPPSTRTLRNNTGSSASRGGRR